MVSKIYPCFLSSEVKLVVGESVVLFLTTSMVNVTLTLSLVFTSPIPQLSTTTLTPLNTVLPVSPSNISFSPRLEVLPCAPVFILMSISLKPSAIAYKPLSPKSRSALLMSLISFTSNSLYSVIAFPIRKNLSYCFSLLTLFPLSKM